MRNKELYKSMLAAVQTISEEVKEKPFNQSLVQSLVSIAKPVADFFNLTTEETIVLCYFIDANLKDQIVNKESIITHFGKEKNKSLHFTSLLLVIFLYDLSVITNKITTKGSNNSKSFFNSRKKEIP